MGRADDAQSAILKDLAAFDRLNAGTMPSWRPDLAPSARKYYQSINQLRQI
jgi:hypothetical protein